ncbi:MAG: hypothetical protein HYV63_07145 [Candidatus Schekmanbacteria bacterium]|nr:hypothetical protein [Candidatus Schekmanbacteria bacterium]
MWYIVKRNWPATAAGAGRAMQGGGARYCGLGGDVWPLDGAAGDRARGAHDRLMSRRAYLELGDGSGFMACTDLASAREYLAVAREILPDCMLVGLDEGRLGEAALGFDLGAPAGGYSVIESEIIIAAPHPERARPQLNELGLFATLSALESYLAARSDDPSLEEIDSCAAVAVRLVE